MDYEHVLDAFRYKVIWISTTLAGTNVEDAFKRAVLEAGHEMTSRLDKEMQCAGGRCISVEDAHQIYTNLIIRVLVATVPSDHPAMGAIWCRMSRYSSSPMHIVRPSAPTPPAVVEGGPDCGTMQ